jgi:hypothetical protein
MKIVCFCFLVFVSLTIWRIAFGAPFLVCEPHPNTDVKPIKYLVTIDGNTSESIAVKNPDGSVFLQYDLGSFSDGIYTVKVRAVDAKGNESPTATVSFKKTGSEAELYTPPVPKQKIPPSRQYNGHIKMEKEDSQ